jgi:hypothetical protein
MFRMLILMLLTIYSSLGVATDYIAIPHERVGIILAGWTIEDVQANLKPEDYRMDQDIEEDGGTLETLVLFPDSKNRLIIKLHGKEKQLSIARTCQKGSLWITENRLKIGSSLAEVEAINGKPLIISGWGWDFGGQLISNNEGNYEGPILWFTQPSMLAKEYSGDKDIESQLITNRENIFIKCIDVYLFKKA